MAGAKIPWLLAISVGYIPKPASNKSKAKSLEASDIKESNIYIYIYIPLRIMMIVSPRACSGVDAGFEGSILLSRGALKLCCGRI